MITNRGIRGNVDIATKEFNLVSATIRDDLDINRTKNPIRRIHGRLCCIDPILGYHTKLIARR